MRRSGDAPLTRIVRAMQAEKRRMAEIDSARLRATTRRSEAAGRTRTVRSATPLGRAVDKLRRPQAQRLKMHDPPVRGRKRAVG